MRNNKLIITSITCNRPALFSKSLSGISKSLLSSEIDSEIIVCDDSSDGEVRTKNKEIVKNAIREHQVDILYLGKEEKKHLIQSLQDVNFDEKIKNALEFAFFGDRVFEFLKGPGTNRNAALTACAGRRFLSLDDDTDMRFFSRKGTEDNIEISTKKPDLEFAAFANWKNVDKVCVPFSEDSLALFDKMVAATSSEKIREFKQKDRHIYYDDAIKSCDVKNSPVKVVMAGICGGRWYSRPFGFYFADGALRKSMFRKKRDYEHAKFSPIAVMHAPRFVLSPHPVLVSTAVGVDAREIVPPFIPHIRNQDTIWGMLMKYCYRESFTAHLPFAISHVNSEKVSFKEEDFTRVTADAGLMTSLIMRDIGRRINKLSPDKVLQRVGEIFISFSRLSHKEWMAYLRSLWLVHVGTSCNELERLLEKHRRRPAYWAKDVQNFMENIRGQALEPSAYLPREFLSVWNEREAGERYQNLLYRYGELLIAWPLIWKSVQKLNTENGGLESGGSL